MKKTLLFMGLFAATALNAQTVYYSQDFNASANLPANWFEWNRDGKTVASNLSSYSFGTSGWKIRSNTAGTERWAISPSWFSPAGQANRWLVSERITLPPTATNTVLTFAAFPYDDQFPDGIVVRLSTTDSLPESATVLLDSVNETGGQAVYSINLQAYAGQTFRLAFGNRSNDKVILGLDDIKIFSAPNWETENVDFYINEHNTPGSSLDVKGTFTNHGFNTINKAKLNYQVNGGSVVSSQLSSLNWKTEETKTFTSGTPFTTSTPGTYVIKTWISNLNDSTINLDANKSNDTLSQTVFFYESTGLAKKVLAENYTGAWCGFCPEGDHLLEVLVAARPNVIGMNIHDRNGGSASADAMQIPEGHDIVLMDMINGFPSTTFDRKYWETIFGQSYGRHSFGVSDSSTNTTDYAPFTIWPEVADERSLDLTPVGVSIANRTWNDTTKTLKFDVRADFKVANLKGDFRINAYLVEDSIAKNASGYNQANYWCAGCGAENSQAWAYQFADPQPGFVHNMVLRKGMDGAWGNQGSIANPTATQVYTRSYSYVIPSTMRPEKMRIIAVVDEYNSDNRYLQVLNSDQLSVVGFPAGIKNLNVINKLGMYPNPVSSVANFELELADNATIKIEIMNSLGQATGVMFESEQNAGAHTVTLPVTSLANGVYFAKVSVNGESKVLNFTIAK
ncbi:MAG: Omp28-related outer membrane protein [Chitinophagales bacterium]